MAIIRRSSKASKNATIAAQNSLLQKYANNVLRGEGEIGGEENLWREIYTPLVPLNENSGGWILGISSPADNEGKTTVALGLAKALADDLEKSIVLVDSNLFRPTMSEVLEKGESLGLTDCLTGNNSIEVVTQPTSLKNLWFLPAGRPVTNPSRSYRSAAMAGILKELRASFDLVVLDMPSILSSSDTRVLLPILNGLLVIVRVGVSTTPDVETALTMTEEVGRRGIVLNDFHSSVPKGLQRLVLKS